MQPRRRIKQPHLAVSSPFDPHLGCPVDKINLRVKYVLSAGAKLQKVAQQRYVISLQRMPAGTEKIQRLTIPEKKRLLRLMHDQLRAEIKILLRVLVSQHLITALILNDTDQFQVFTPFPLKQPIR